MTQRSAQRWYAKLLEKARASGEGGDDADTHAVNDFLTRLPAKLPLPTERFETCAVVGNSAILRESNLGSEIDAHTCVFRFNYPPLVEFARDVGTRVDYMFTGASTVLQSKYAPYMRYSHYYEYGSQAKSDAQFSSRNANLTLVLFPPSANAGALKQAAARFDKLRDLPAVLYLSDYFLTLSNRVLREYGQKLKRANLGNAKNAKGHYVRATSGLRGVLAALLLCNHTDVYGFGKSRALGNGHYYSPPDHGLLAENPGHNYTLENHLIRSLANEVVGLRSLDCEASHENNASSSTTTKYTSKNNANNDTVDDCNTTVREKRIRKERKKAFKKANQLLSGSVEDLASKARAAAEAAHTLEHLNCSLFTVLASRHTCGSLRINLRNADDSVSLDSARLQSGAAEDRSARWAAQKAERESRRLEKQRGSRNAAGVNCREVVTSAGSIWKCDDVLGARADRNARASAFLEAVNVDVDDVADANNAMKE